MNKEEYMSNEAFIRYENTKFQTKGGYVEIIIGHVYP